MVASFNTTMQVMEAVLRHVDRDTFDLILEDLKKIDGNGSFKDTIKRLEKVAHGC